jgi:methyltransferase (TIGR00027 family)
MTNDARPSQTALMAAAARAAHLIVDRPPVIFADTLAERVLGDQADQLIGFHRAHGTHPVLSTARGQVVCRSRYSRDRLADAVVRGTTQYVILGAGLDSFGYCSPLAGQVRVFEVDHPATQQWKRGLLAAAAIPVPPGVAFVPVDFERDSLADRLGRAGFDPARPAFASWLGVSMYLTEAAIGHTLAEVGRFAPGSELVADYMLPAGLRDAVGDSYVEQVAPVAAERGEPWLSFLSPQAMSVLLGGCGLTQISNVGQAEIGDAATWTRSDSLRPTELSMLAHAAVA